MNNPSLLKSFESSRLFYRPFEKPDAKAIHTFLQDKDIADNTLTIPYPYEAGMAEEWISTHEERFEQGDYVYAVILKNEKQLIGAIDFIVDEEYQHANVGYWLGKPYWGKGYGTEMLSRMIQFGFEDLNLHRIYGEYFDFNLASSRIMEKNGMRYEGRLRDHKLKGGQFLSANVRGILKDEWKATSR